MNDSLGTYKTEILPVGSYYHLKTGKDWIVYAGLVSDDVFSVVQMKQRGYQGYGWNLYFPTKSQDIVIDRVNVHVIRVTTQEIEFRVAQ